MAFIKSHNKYRWAGVAFIVVLLLLSFGLLNSCTTRTETPEKVQEKQALVSQNKQKDLPELPFKPPSGNFDIQGAGTHALWIVFKDLEEQFEKDTGIRLQLWGSKSAAGKGCDAGVKMAGEGSPKTEFGMMCCKPSEADLKSKSLVSYPLAREPIMIIIHPSNPVDNLTESQVRDIFSGKIINWKEVRGKNRPIGVVTRLHCADRPGHWKRILPEPDLFAENRLDVKSEYDMAETVARYDNSVGHLGITWITGGKLKILKVNGAAPDAEGIKSGKYPFKRLLNVLTRGKASGGVRRFIEYVRDNPSTIKYYEKYSLLKLTKEESKPIYAGSRKIKK